MTWPNWKQQSSRIRSLFRSCTPTMRSVLSCQWKRYVPWQREKAYWFFSDATQAVGKIPIDVNNIGIDLLAFTAHKMYGPKGVGALYVRRKNPRVKLTAQMDGGGHERGMRSGTLNVPGIVGLGKACEICRTEMADRSNKSW